MVYPHGREHRGDPAFPAACRWFFRLARPPVIDGRTSAESSLFIPGRLWGVGGGSPSGFARYNFFPKRTHLNSLESTEVFANGRNEPIRRMLPQSTEDRRKAEGLMPARDGFQIADSRFQRTILLRAPRPLRLRLRRQERTHSAGRETDFRLQTANSKNQNLLLFRGPFSSNLARSTLGPAGTAVDSGGSV